MKEVYYMKSSIHIKKNDFKNELLKIVENDYNTPSIQQKNKYCSLMLANLGDVDPELRDDLIFDIFTQWIGRKNYFSQKKLYNILGILLDPNHLYYKLGTMNDDSVYMRSFSLLIIGKILNKHCEIPFLSKKYFDDISKLVIRYYTLEKDLRGYSEKNGWAHCAAHGADTIDDIISCKEFDKVMVPEILEAIKNVLHNGSEVFQYEEEERIAKPIYRLLKRKYLELIEFSDWLKALTEFHYADGSIEQYRSRVNSKNFVRCLYFKVLHLNGNREVIDTLQVIEKKLNIFVEIDREI